MMFHKKFSHGSEDHEPEYFNFVDIINLNLKWLNYFGIILHNKDTAGLFRMSFFILFTYTSMLLSEFINFTLNAGNREELSSNLFLFLTHFVQLKKYYHIYRYHERLKHLIKTTQRAEFVPKTENQRQILMQYIKESKVITTVFLAACFATCSLWGVYPFTDEALSLPLAGWFPWETKESPNFELTYIYQIIAATLNGLTNISIDTLISGLLMVICSQLHILNDSLENIQELVLMEMDNKPISNMSADTNKILIKKLEECVQHHICILKFAEEVSFLFSTSILSQFLISGLIICLTLFEMTLIPVGSIKFFSLMLYLYCMLMEIFLWCYYGNEVTYQSSRLTNSAFHCGWYSYSKEFRRNMFFFTIRSQKVLRLYAGGFFTLSLGMFVRILKTSWSYFAVLLQINEVTSI